MKGIELFPELFVGLTIFISDHRELYHNAAVEEVRTPHELLDAVHDHRTSAVEHGLLVVGVELPRAEAFAARNPTESVREPLIQE